MFPCIWLRTVLSSVFLSIWGRDSLAAKIERASEWNSGREWQIVELFHIANLIDCFMYSMSDSKWCETQKCHLQKKREKNKHMKHNLQTRKKIKELNRKKKNSKNQAFTFRNDFGTRITKIFIVGYNRMNSLKINK